MKTYALHIPYNGVIWALNEKGFTLKMANRRALRRVKRWCKNK